MTTNSLLSPAALEHRLKLHTLWIGGHYCDECSDTGTVEDIRLEDDTARPYSCTDCHECRHCGASFADEASDPLLWLPEGLMQEDVGWCSPYCLRTEVRATDDPWPTIRGLCDVFAEYHWGPEGLGLDYGTWISVATPRERATDAALREERSYQEQQQVLRDSFALGYLRGALKVIARGAEIGAGLAASNALSATANGRVIDAARKGTG